jgi:hypothetical protein
MYVNINMSQHNGMDSIKNVVDFSLIYPKDDTVLITGETHECILYRVVVSQSFISPCIGHRTGLIS